MGSVPKSCIRTTELQSQQAGAAYPGWVAGVCPCFLPPKLVHGVGADLQWGERLGNMLGGQLPQLGCWAASCVTAIT